MIPHLLVHPNLGQRQEEAKKILSQQGLTLQHPDLLWIDDEKLGVGEVKKIREHLSLKPYQALAQAIVILQAENLTADAQNALLKTLEEPPGEAILILGVASEDQLLSTITSRCQTVFLDSSIDQKKDLSEKDIKNLEELVNYPLEKRFVFIEKLEDREEFLLTLTAYFRHKLLENPSSDKQKKILSFLEDLLEAQKWAKQNVNIRAILEYLMFKIP